MLDAEEYFHLALHASSIGDPHACLMHLGQVLHQEPKNAGATYLLATVHAELGLVERAIRGFESVLAVDPRLTIARLQLAMLLLLFDTKRRAEAKTHLMYVTATRDESLQTYAEALIAVADDHIPLATEKLERAISRTAEDTPFTSLMKRLLDHLKMGKLGIEVGVR
jgi:predicted Zn-dependent protease